MDANTLSPGTVLWHKKGYFSICIVDKFTDSMGETWITYFNRNNAGGDYAEYDGAFMSQFDDSVPTAPPEAVVLENFHKSNKMEVASLNRLLNEDKFTTTEVPVKAYVPKVVGDRMPVKHMFPKPRPEIDMPSAIDTLDILQQP